MRLTVFIGLMLVAYDCLEKASGATPQLIFASDQKWLWIIPMLWWGVMAIIALVEGVE